MVSHGRIEVFSSDIPGTPYCSSSSSGCWSSRHRHGLAEQEQVVGQMSRMTSFTEEKALIFRYLCTSSSVLPTDHCVVWDGNLLCSCLYVEDHTQTRHKGKAEAAEWGVGQRNGLRPRFGQRKEIVALGTRVQGQGGASPKGAAEFQASPFLTPPGGTESILASGTCAVSHL